MYSIDYLKALEAIKQYEARTKKMLEKNKMMKLGYPSNLFKLSQGKYEHALYHKKLNIDKMVKIQLFPNAEDFYFLSMEDCCFPIRIIMKNVRNSGTLFVGYDR